ncbi:MAG: cysteine hydrolase [Methanospirillaceae archaeon]|nr:cysteine hydrolase [Methanospirillaceae archaeon]
MATKESYLTAENINTITSEVLSQLRRDIRQRDIPFIPEESALLIIDMQMYFTDPHSHAYIPACKPIIPRIKELAEAFSAQDRPVFCTMHCNTDADAGRMAVWWKDLLNKENRYSSITSDLIIPGAYTIKKTQYDGFYQTELESELQNRDIKTVVITGVMTHLCCETTARSAFIRGYNVFIPLDATATSTYRLYLASLTTLSDGFASIVTTRELLSKPGGIEQG